ncbi:MAG: hypothetical protein JW904_07595 [Spirochaetales bacterium]|nr:hypothetical protein [Spirochaetales bacterium]
MNKIIFITIILVSAFLFTTCEPPATATPSTGYVSCSVDGVFYFADMGLHEFGEIPHAESNGILLRILASTSYCSLAVEPDQYFRVYIDDVIPGTFTGTLNYTDIVGTDDFSGNATYTITRSEGDGNFVEGTFSGTTSDVRPITGGNFRVLRSDAVSYFW